MVEFHLAAGQSRRVTVLSELAINIIDTVIIVNTLPHYQALKSVKSRWSRKYCMEIIVASIVLRTWIVDMEKCNGTVIPSGFPSQKLGQDPPSPTSPTKANQWRHSSMTAHWGLLLLIIFNFMKCLCGEMCCHYFEVAIPNQLIWAW